MSIIQIRRVKRENARLLIVLSSWTGEGKTFSAIQLGYGLANFQPSKLGLLDAENRRGSLYEDVLEKSTRPTKERFLIGDLYPPFTPRRYMGAIDEFQAAGVEVLIVDSATHEWEGTGGCQEIAEAGNPKIPNWALAKKQHKEFMNKLLQADMHIICCVRAREKSKPEKGPDGKIVFADLGLTPIQEKNFMFEATASLMMYDKGMRQEIIKCPAALLNILGRQKGYLTADDGKALRDWVDGALQLDPIVERFRNRLLSNTEGGLQHIENCWGQTPEAVRQSLGDAFYGTLVESAKTYDQMKADAEAAGATETGEGGGAAAGGAKDAPPAEDTSQAADITAKAQANGAAAKEPATPLPKDQPAAPAASTPAATPAAAAKTTAPAAAAKQSASPPAAAKKDPPPPAQGDLTSDPIF